MNYLKKRVKEGSTWAGLFSLVPHALTMATSGATPVGVAGLLISLICVIVPEAGSAK